MQHRHPEVDEHRLQSAKGSWKLFVASKNVQEFLLEVQAPVKRRLQTPPSEPSLSARIMMFLADRSPCRMAGPCAPGT